MSNANELLRQALETWAFWHPALDPESEPLFRDISAYLEENPQDEPIAYWDTQKGKLIPAVPLSSERTCFEVPLVPLYLHPPHPFIRLTDEEIKMLTDSSVSPDWTDEFELYHFARSVEDALVEKNK